MSSSKPVIRQKNIRELIDEVAQLSCCYAIWWQMMNKPDRLRYSRVITKEYLHFFFNISAMLEENFHVIIYQLFETKNFSIPTQSKTLPKSDVATTQKIEAAISAHKTILAKVFTIRCNVHAHRNSFEAPEDVYTRVKLTPNEMKKLVCLAQDLVTLLASAKGVGNKQEIEADLQRRQERARDATKSLLEALVSK